LKELKLVLPDISLIFRSQEMNGMYILLHIIQEMKLSI
jgi:hypothetical protein